MLFAFERDGPRPDSWSFYDCIWWGLIDDCWLPTSATHVSCQAGLLTLFFAVCYRSKRWRNEIATRKRIAKGKNNSKEDILFNLATSSGMSGVRVEREILHSNAGAEEEYEQLTLNQNKYVLDSLASTPASSIKSEVA